jgi:hypothetical protein
VSGVECPTPFWLDENGVFVPIHGPAEGSPPDKRGMVGFVNGDGPHAFFSLASVRDNSTAAYYISPEIVAPTTAPTSPHAQTTPHGIRISWHPVAGATRYEVWQAQPKLLLGSTSTTSYLDTRARHPQRTRYQVRARNAAGAGPFSPAVTAPATGR